MLKPRVALCHCLGQRHGIEADFALRLVPADNLAVTPDDFSLCADCMTVDATVATLVAHPLILHSISAHRVEQKCSISVRCGVMMWVDTTASVRLMTFSQFPHWVFAVTIPANWYCLSACTFIPTSIGELPMKVYQTKSHPIKSGSVHNVESDVKKCGSASRLCIIAQVRCYG